MTKDQIKEKMVQIAAFIDRKENRRIELVMAFAQAFIFTIAAPTSGFMIFMTYFSYVNLIFTILQYKRKFPEDFSK